jgi:response regulator NasT
MDNILVVTQAQKNTAFLMETLNMAFCGSAISVLHSGAQVRQQIIERDFDLAIIDAPLLDESGESLSRYIASKDKAQVILMVKGEIFDEISAITENDGVLVVVKPLDKNLFWSALKLAQSTQKKLKKMRAENSKLKQRIEDIRIVDRAKWILISNLKMTEQEAHRFIEKQAMDIRATRREIAERILKTYES